MVDGILYLNPGSISQPRGKYSHLKTYAIVETSEKEIEVAFYTQNHEKLSDLTFTFPRED
jgi:predicted phosphodiesterase